MQQMVRTRKSLRLGDMLVEKGLITQSQLDYTLQLQKQDQGGKLLGEILIELGYTSEDSVVECLATAYGVPYASLNPELADPAVYNVLPADFIDVHSVLPLFKVRDTLTIAVPEPSNLFLIEEIAHITGCSVQVVAATASDIRRTAQAIRAEATSQGERQQFKIDLSQTPALDDAARSDPAECEAMLGKWSTEKIANFIILDARANRASEVHIEHGTGNPRVRYRIDGRLHLALMPPRRLMPDLFECLKAMAGCSMPTETGAPAVVAATSSVTVGGYDLNLNVNALPSLGGEKMLIRLSSAEREALSLERLGFELAVLKNYQRILARTRGMVIVTGPRRSGKTTTLYASLASMDCDLLNVCTVENPITFNLPAVNQFQPDPRRPDFASSRDVLEAMLLQSPDCLFIDSGSLDEETARLAADAALGGLLVLVEVNARDAASAVRQLLPTSSADTVLHGLSAVLSQRLVRKVCPHCKQQYQPPPGVRRQFQNLCGPVSADPADALPAGEFARGSAAEEAEGAAQASQPSADPLGYFTTEAGMEPDVFWGDRAVQRPHHTGPVEVFYHGQGCKHCGQTGYAGCIGLFELALMNRAAVQVHAGLTGPQDSMPRLAELLQPAANCTIAADASEKVRAGLTTPEEVLDALDL
ncbi:MAG: ATPase, T2SS/T4P/T4SS family [Planctomycetia bacterium]|nr:ATPase, T2SS/T4P/T4SS family [Planctomycetia bacterium]